MYRILIIEDNKDICYTLQEICKYAGWECKTAENGYEGILEFKKSDYDLIIIDYHMPILDGLKTLKEIRKIDKNIPVIILTVDERIELANELLKAGATDFALKPIKAPDLISRIKVNLKVGVLTQEQDSASIKKGINKNTENIIIKFLESQVEPVTIDVVARETKLAYQTIHRYLNFFVKKGIVETDFNYGKIGRPKNVYWLNK